MRVRTPAVASLRPDARNFGPVAATPSSGWGFQGATSRTCFGNKTAAVVGRGVLVVSADHRPALPATIRYVRWRTDPKKGRRYSRFLHIVPIGQAVLLKVVAKLGGSYVAASQLGVSQWALERFLEGTVPVPDPVLLRAVDIVLDDLQVRPADSQTFRRVQP